MLSDQIDLWLKVANFGLAVLAIAFAYFRTRDRATAKSFDAHDKDIHALERRVVIVEKTLEQLPVKDDVHSILVELTKMRGELQLVNAGVATQREIMQRVESVVGRHEDHLHDRSGG